MHFVRVWGTIIAARVCDMTVKTHWWHADLVSSCSTLPWLVIVICNSSNLVSARWCSRGDPIFHHTFSQFKHLLHIECRPNHTPFRSRYAPCSRRSLTDTFQRSSLRYVRPQKSWLSTIFLSAVRCHVEIRTLNGVLHLVVLNMLWWHKWK